MTAIIFIFLSSFSWATEPLQREEAERICKEQTRWGYYRQPGFHLDLQDDFWSVKDLFGSFRTLEECEESRKTYKKGRAENCQAFGVGDKEIIGLYVAAKIKTYSNKEDFIFFREKETCEKSVKAGGFFKAEGMDKEVGGTNDPFPSSGFEQVFNFVGTCELKKISVCKPKEPFLEWTDMN